MNIDNLSDHEKADLARALADGLTSEEAAEEIRGWRILFADEHTPVTCGPRCTCGALR